MLRVFILGSLGLLSIFNVTAEERIVYGQDNRLETFEANKKYQTWAKSTAGMIDTLKLIDLGSHFMLPPSSLGRDYQLCEDERFGDQPSPLSCSGFLVGPDLLVTAGHCIHTQEDCNRVSWIFDFKVNANNDKANVAIDKKNVFTCKKVLDSKFEGKGQTLRDYSLIRLNKKVPNRAALNFRRAGKVLDRTELVIIGHPSGLPQKVADKGFVFENTSKHFFKTNLDSFGGNSGSAVFNAKSGTVEGILVRGATDYVSDSCGTRVNRVGENITGKRNLGESVSRITDIDALKKRGQFLKLMGQGSLSKGKALFSEVDQAFLLEARDEIGNTPLHLAVKSKSLKKLTMLIEAGADIDAQNSDGETALHVAAFINNKRAVMMLVDSGADLLIRDKFNSLPSERTNYLAFKLRSYLRKLQNQAKKKLKK